MYKFIFWFSDVLCVTGVWSLIVWGVSYTSTEICALRGSTVDITSTYTYPSRWNDLDTTVQKTFWFIKESNGIHVDLSTDPEYSGRVENLCGNNTCTLRISNLTESDSAVYKFRFTTNRGGVHLVQLESLWTSQVTFTSESVWNVRVFVEIKSQFVHSPSAPGTSEEINSQSISYLDRADLSQQVSAPWSSFLRLVQ